MAEELYRKKLLRQSVGWAQLDILKYPELVPYQNENVAYPIQIIGGF